MALEQAFNCVARKVIWWVRKLGAEQRVVRLVHGMYTTREGGLMFVRLQFEAKLGVRQRSILNSLLFIIVLGALSRELRSGIP